MRIEALENIRSEQFTLTEGDVVTVPNDVGAHWCAMGWAKDTSGTIPTGERSTAPRELSVAGA